MLMFTVNYKSSDLFKHYMIASILLGGNLGNRKAYLSFASFHIKKDVGEILDQSAIYESAPWGARSNKAYLNQVIQVETNLKPLDLLKKLLAIEQKAGRTRLVKWGNRTLDIDILFLEQNQINTSELVVPHPEIENRRFVLTCLLDINPKFKHPTLNKTIKELLDICPDHLSVQIFEN